MEVLTDLNLLFEAVDLIDALVFGQFGAAHLTACLELVGPATRGIIVAGSLRLVTMVNTLEGLVGGFLLQWGPFRVHNIQRLVRPILQLVDVGPFLIVEPNYGVIVV